MKVAKLRTDRRKGSVKITSYNIASYGEDNDYPDKIIDIFNASPTGKGCLNVCRRFIFGDGYIDQSLATTIVNRKGQTANHVLRKAVDDLPLFGGFAIHVNYNGLLEPVEYQVIPFDHCRIEINKDGLPTTRIAVHPNWNNKDKLRKFDKRDIKYYPSFNPRKKVLFEQVAEVGGIESFRGQVLYFSMDGELVYPLCPYDPTVTDMSTEESISTVLHRNARYNYLPAGMIVKKSKVATTNEGNKERNNFEESELASDIANWQGDERAAKMILVETEFDEEAPQFIPFTIQNFDRMFDSTTKYVQDSIGRMFMQPPILRGVDVGAGFGADLMKNAYDFYNTIIENERKLVEEVMAILFKIWPQEFSDYTIKPMEYLDQATGEELSLVKEIPPELLKDLSKNERRNLIGFNPEVDKDADTVRLATEIGVGGTQSMIEIMTSETLTTDQRINLLITLFSLTEQEAKTLVGDEKLGN